MVHAVVGVKRLSEARVEALAVVSVQFGLLRKFCARASISRVLVEVAVAYDFPYFEGFCVDLVKALLHGGEVDFARGIPYVAGVARQSSGHLVARYGANIAF